MCGYDPFQWYEDELDRDYEAYLHGYDNYEDYYNAMQDDLGNREYDEWKDKQE